MLTLRLQIIGNLVHFPQLDREPDYDYQYDNVVSAIMDLCDVLEETNIFQFQVSGFGQERWPVDVRTDLSTILEQIPQILHSIACANYPFQLDFYEQGVERQLNFEEADTCIKISCYSGTFWEPNPSACFVRESDILMQLYNLRDSFVEAVKIVCPKLASSELFAIWCKNSGAKK
ncbi:hypothetical protein Osc7112_6546 (plasmid) [Oscillatoria nigro-viridis PCC 7112]|uniref:Uncharacterized protein n=1 Tax=Phormidium nigroviride PCC 7112 TaxID=179408 RepID=K9VTY7_9CYAN|nr:hypothetical protein [Oscillatoria nigro-viridis]AFZ10680.1 hypothetical protein Osc7112_6546 [Oscillatoria nigro-viridis PCC 7112]